MSLFKLDPSKVITKMLSSVISSPAALSELVNTTLPRPPPGGVGSGVYVRVTVGAGVYVAVDVLLGTGVYVFVGVIGNTGESPVAVETGVRSWQPALERISNPAMNKKLISGNAFIYPFISSAGIIYADGFPGRQILPRTLDADLSLLDLLKFSYLESTRPVPRDQCPSSSPCLPLMLY